MTQKPKWSKTGVIIPIPVNEFAHKIYLDQKGKLYGSLYIWSAGDIWTSKGPSEPLAITKITAHAKWWRRNSKESPRVPAPKTVWAYPKVTISIPFPDNEIHLDQYGNIYETIIINESGTIEISKGPNKYNKHVCSKPLIITALKIYARKT